MTTEISVMYGSEKVNMKEQSCIAKSYNKKGLCP